MKESDVSNVRNGLLLCKGIEEAFDRLQLSFVKSNPLSMDLFLKIWDDSCRSNPLYPGSTILIGGFDGSRLDLSAHKPFLRALSFQAYQSYLVYKNQTMSVAPAEYGSDPECEYFKGRELLKSAVLRDIQFEVHDEDS